MPGTAQFEIAGTSNSVVVQRRVDDHADSFAHWQGQAGPTDRAARFGGSATTGIGGTMDEEHRLHPRGYFEALYRNSPDPWGFGHEWYEQRKYDLTVAALPRSRYRRAVEPGCANGDLSLLLAARCDELISYDFVPAVVDRARRRLADCVGAHVVNAEFPAWWPDGTGDLVVWSEVAYYLHPPAWDEAICELERWLEPGGTLVAVHYLGATDYPMSGEAVAARLDEVAFLDRTVHHREAAFELAVWTRIKGQGPSSAPRA